MRSVPMKRSLDSIRCNVNIGGLLWIVDTLFPERGTNNGSDARLDVCSFQKKMRLSSPSAVTDFCLCSYLAILVVILTSFKYLFGFCSL